jgi:hypothetical protein
MLELADNIPQVYNLCRLPVHCAGVNLPLRPVGCLASRKLPNPPRQWHRVAHQKHCTHSGAVHFEIRHRPRFSRELVNCGSGRNRTLRFWFRADPHLTTRCAYSWQLNPNPRARSPHQQINVERACLAACLELGQQQPPRSSHPLWLQPQLCQRQVGALMRRQLQK